MNALECWYVCLAAAGLVLPLIVFSAISAGLFVAYKMEKGYKALVGAQMMVTVMISTSLASMDCYMSTWVWFYLGAVIAGAIGIGMLRAYSRSRLAVDALGRFDALANLEDEFDVYIVVLDTQRVRALAYKDTVYLSMGLLERLDDDQLRAVVAHEVYHLETRPPRMLSWFLALTSLTFLRYSDEREADAYAAHLISEEALVGALESLRIRDRDERASRLRQQA
ncbi:MAG: M48 family metalloprotease [Thermoplasmata archaeon]|nr:MAG: M48 family metalloprotease [Thermoplasmata archaeon]